MKLTTNQILKLVEFYVSQDISEKCKVCSKVYKAVHSHRETKCTHLDWEREAYGNYQALKAAKQI